jgi:hypothetical protein
MLCNEILHIHLHHSQTTSGTVSFSLYQDSYLIPFCHYSCCRIGKQIVCNLHKLFCHCTQDNSIQYFSCIVQIIISQDYDFFVTSYTLLLLFMLFGNRMFQCCCRYYILFIIIKSIVKIHLIYMFTTNTNILIFFVLSYKILINTYLD